MINKKYMKSFSPLPDVVEKEQAKEIETNKLSIILDSLNKLIGKIEKLEEKIDGIYISGKS